MSLKQEDVHVSLLTLSRSDLQSPSAPTSNDVVLMQLPSSLQLSDLNTARIQAPDTSKQACLVLETKGMAFSVSRVETSNALVMVPVPPYAETLSEQQGPRPSKKLKPNQTLVLVPSMLLQPGGSGASFLELKPRHLDTDELLRLLQNHVYDPYQQEHATWTGRSSASLALELQCSEKQVRKGLQEIQALGLEVEGTVRYGLLAEEAQLEATRLAIATLLECDDFVDYATKGVHVKQFVREAHQRVPQMLSEQYLYLTQVMIHTLQSLAPSSSDRPSDKDTIHHDQWLVLDFAKVAVCVARDLLQKAATCRTPTEFLGLWERSLPGVGTPSLDLLRGVALVSDNQIEYFPEDKLPLEPEARFKALFRAREKWRLEDISPYVKRMASPQNGSESELLRRYCQTVVQDANGASVTYYVKRA